MREVGLISNDPVNYLGHSIWYQMNYLSSKGGFEFYQVSSDFKRFRDGEVFVKINESVRGKDIFFLSTIGRSVNDSVIQLLIGIDALRRASAKSITVVLPYFPYARQDRKVEPRTPISAKLLANLIETAGADKLITIDLHVGQIQGFFDIPVDNLYTTNLFKDKIQEIYKVSDLVIVSPDAGGMERARRLAKRLNAPTAMIDKRRPKPNVSEVMHVVGDVKDKVCVIVDDIVDTGGTLVNAADALLDKGAQSVSAFITHGLLSDPALERIENSNLEELYITDTIMRRILPENGKIKVLSISNLIAEAIYRSVMGLSVNEIL